MWTPVTWEGLSVHQVNKGSDLEKHTKAFIHSVWGSANENIFPGPHPVSIERKHIKTLKENPYVVCEKTDGTRYFLCCTVFQEKKFTIFVNRAFDMFVVPLAVPRHTILDGEMVNGKFVIYDAILVNGERIWSCDFITRLKKAEFATRGPPCSGIKLIMKKMWPLNKFDELQSQTFDYETDGFIFTPVNEPIKMETHETMFKWKPLDRITVDFIVLKGNLCIWDKHHGMVVTQKVDEKYENEIVECKYSSGQWVPIKIRTDKNHPNNRRTLMRTLVNIRENILPCEFQSE